MQDDKRKLKLLALIGGAALLIAAVGLLYALWERAPETAKPATELAAAASAPTPTPLSTAADAQNTAEPTPEPMPEGLAPDSPRQDGVYTILLAGLDKISGSTDTMLICRLDSRSHKLNVVSLPRDTLINADWAVRKLNSVYAGAINSDEDGAEALLFHARKLLGFEPDCYAVISLDTFMAVIDCMGGVDFNVPIQMDYDDDAQRLYIHLEPGLQHLNGYQAMGLCRFRADYITGDLGRIELQQDFMRACARQFISLGQIPNAREAIRILSEGLDTNMSAANMAWFMRQLLLCRQEDIIFDTMPFDDAILQDLSYAVPRLWDWLPLINELLNPYETPVTYGDVDVVYRGENGYCATGTLLGTWYYEAPREAPKSPAQAEASGGAESAAGPTIISVVPGEEAPSILAPVEDGSSAPPEAG